MQAEATEPSSPSVIGALLRIALERLAGADKRLHSDGERFREASLSGARLRAEGERLDRSEALRPPRRREEALEQWRRFKASAHGELSRRLVRNLSWEGEAVVDESFHKEVGRVFAENGLSEAMLKGMLRSIHAGWGALDKDSYAVRTVRHYLSSRARPTAMSRRWKTSLAALTEGPQHLALLVSGRGTVVHDLALGLGVDEGTNYFLRAMMAAVQDAVASLTTDGTSLDDLTGRLLAWPRWPAGVEKGLVGELVMHPLAERECALREGIRRYVLGPKGPGDPRLIGNRERWSGIRLEARARVVEWLSRADIVLFFETILPDKRDRHRRREFWLEYVGRIRDSRPILIQVDRERLSQAFKGREVELQHVGFMRSTLSSAFMLSFDNVLVVEFATLGRAYFYTGARRDELMKLFQVKRSISDTELKSVRNASDSVVHSVGWQAVMRGILAKYGVRPLSAGHY